MRCCTTVYTHIILILYRPRRDSSDAPRLFDAAAWAMAFSYHCLTEASYFGAPCLLAKRRRHCQNAVTEETRGEGYGGSDSSERTQGTS
jgi:hypothetical protein